jgi:hypothetical protein
MRTNDTIESILTIIGVIVKTPVFILGCFVQPLYLYWHLQDEKERISRRASFARRLGLTLDLNIRRRMKKTYRFLRKVNGRGQYALNIMTGKYKGHEVTLFDYHTRSIAWHATVWEYGRWIEHHYQSFLVVNLGQDFPALSIDKEFKVFGFVPRIMDTLGIGDIDFEAHEFSEKFKVRSRDKRFAYDFCNVQMMEHLLALKVLHLPITVERSALFIGIDLALNMQDIEANLAWLLAIRERMPGYLFTDQDIRIMSS